MKKLSPEKQLELHLAKGGFPSKDIPTILKYCPQLIHHFSLDELSAIGLTNPKLFKPEQYRIYLRPYVYQAAKKEAGNLTIQEYIEESIAICANDTMELSLTEMFIELQNKIKECRDE